MIDEVQEYERLLTTYFELDDLQATEIVIAAAVSHKLKWSEMLWLRIIGASGSGKTELLRTLSYEPYSVTMETITAGAIRRGFVVKKNGKPEQTLMQRLDGKLVITKEFASIITKNTDAQNEIFGLLRGVYDGTTDADYGSEQGHLTQTSHFDWILGSTTYIDKIRSIEYQLGSRFIDLHWDIPQNENKAISKAIANNGELAIIRARLGRAMSNIIDITKEVPKPKLDYVTQLAIIAAHLRSPVERSSRSMEIVDLPSTELGTRIGQALSRIATGLVMIGVEEQSIRPYMTRLVFNSMTRIRARIIEAWMLGLVKQADIAASIPLSQGTVSHIIEEINLLGWKNEWLEILKGGG